MSKISFLGCEGGKRFYHPKTAKVRIAGKFARYMKARQKREAERGDRLTYRPALVRGLARLLDFSKSFFRRQKI